MPLTTQVLHSYVSHTAGVELADEALERLATACAAVSCAINEVASESLFDTEPEQLHTVLDELAAGYGP